MSQGKLIVLSAPSGAGKTTICNNLLNLNNRWLYSISATTRPMRENEVDGKDYIFMSKEKFEHKEKFGEFIECEWVHGNRYGTPVEPLENALDNGDIFIEETDNHKLHRFSYNKKRWEFVNTIDNKNIGSIHWSRYLEEDSKFHWLKKISCN